MCVLCVCIRLCEREKYKGEETGWDSEIQISRCPASNYSFTESPSRQTDHFVAAVTLILVIVVLVLAIKVHRGLSMYSNCVTSYKHALGWSMILTSLNTLLNLPITVSIYRKNN